MNNIIYVCNTILLFRVLTNQFLKVHDCIESLSFTFQKPTIEIRKSKPNDSHVNNFNSFIFLWCETSHKRDEKFISMPMIKLCRFEHNLILRLEMFQADFSVFFGKIGAGPRSQCS